MGKLARHRAVAKKELFALINKNLEFTRSVPSRSFNFASADWELLYGSFSTCPLFALFFVIPIFLSTTRTESRERLNTHK
jgi:hypothetical protein